MGNPNVLGQLMDWGIALFLLALLLGVGARLRNIVLLISCFVTLVMTASRYGMLGAIVELILVIAIVLPTVRSRQKIVQMAALALSLPLFFLVFQIIASSTLGVSARFEQLKNPLQVDSLRVRLDTVWGNAWASIQASPLLGHGPAKNVFFGVTDSEYLDILKEVGVVGFLPYLAYFLFPLAVLSRGLRVSYRASELLEDNYAANSLALRLAFIMGVTALLMNVGEGTFHNAPLQGFLWMWLGLGARVSQSIVATSRTNFIFPSFQETLTQ
jgi:O-antigen ligase